MVSLIAILEVAINLAIASGLEGSKTEGWV